MRPKCYTLPVLLLLFSGAWPAAAEPPLRMPGDTQVSGTGPADDAACPVQMPRPGTDRLFGLDLRLDTLALKRLLKQPKQPAAGALGRRKAPVDPDMIIWANPNLTAHIRVYKPDPDVDARIVELPGSEAPGRPPCESMGRRAPLP